MNPSDWIALAALVVSVAVAAFQWRLSQKSHDVESRMLEIENARFESEREKQETRNIAASKARLDLHLVGLEGRGFRLVVHNRGQHDAVDVLVTADASSSRAFEELTSFQRIPADGHAHHPFTNHRWQVIGGERLECSVSWTDGQGRHENLPYTATLS